MPPLRSHGRHALDHACLGIGKLRIRRFLVVQIAEVVSRHVQGGKADNRRLMPGIGRVEIARRAVQNQREALAFEW